MKKNKKNKMKGIILAGGNGTRLRPLTYVTNKHLLPIYNKPMILYPLETLKALGISDILIVSGGEHIGTFAEYLGDGSTFDVKLTYRVQTDAGGIAQALHLGEDFSKDVSNIAVILGDNIFDNSSIIFPESYQRNEAIIFGKEVIDPERFGVVWANEKGKVLGIEEKPKKPRSNVAVTGLYIYPSDVFDVIKTLKPSKRGELEITDVNNYYIKKNRCHITRLSGFWSDAGTFDSMLNSSIWIKKNHAK